MFKLREIMSTPTGVTVGEWQYFANGVELHKAVNRFTADGVFVDDCASAARQFRRYGNARFVFRAGWADARTTRMRLIMQVVSR